MREIGSDNGAVAVMTALLMVPILVMAALVLDIAAADVLSRQLKNGADAAALAGAKICARNASCPGLAALTRATARANVLYGDDPASTSVFAARGQNTVKVTTSANVDYIFARAIGYNEQTLTRVSIATWTAPIAATAAANILPIAMSWCAFSAQTGAPDTSTPSIIDASGSTKCQNTAGTGIPGGFGWLEPIGATCSASTTVGQPAPATTGRDVPKACKTSGGVDPLSPVRDTTVLLPVFDLVSGLGSNTTYRISGYVGFHLTGYDFNSHTKWWPAGVPAGTCSANRDCLRGYFTTIDGQTPMAGVTYGNAVDLGAGLITLTK